MISATKATNLTMLDIGTSQESVIARRIVEAAMKGDLSISIPVDYIDEGIERQIRESGYDFYRIKELGEARISWGQK